MDNKTSNEPKINIHEKNGNQIYYGKPSEHGKRRIEVAPPLMEIASSDR